MTNYITFIINQYIMEILLNKQKHLNLNLKCKKVIFGTKCKY